MPNNAHVKSFGPSISAAKPDHGLACAPLRDLFVEMSAEPLPDKLRDLADALEAAFQRRMRG